MQYLVGDQLFWLYIQVFCNFKAELELQELGDGDVVVGRHSHVVGGRIVFGTGHDGWRESVFSNLNFFNSEEKNALAVRA